MKEVFYCSHCGEEMNEEDVYFMGDEIYCLDCLEELTVICEECGERIYIDENEGTENTPLCSYCYQHYYTNCSHCNALIELDDAYYENGACYCHECYQEEIERKSIHSYGYKPDPIFYGEGERFLGVELEIDDGGRDYYNARQILNLANEECEHIYIKEDGSLSDGFEIVSHPMTLDYHKDDMNWEEIMKKALAMGYYSHQCGTAGLHNRDCFGKYAEEQENAISRVLYFVEMFWNEMLRFSRRTESQMQQWANRYGRKNSPKETLYNN